MGHRSTQWSTFTLRSTTNQLFYPSTCSAPSLTHRLALPLTLRLALPLTHRPATPFAHHLALPLPHHTAPTPYITPSKSSSSLPSTQTLQQSSYPSTIQHDICFNNHDAHQAPQAPPNPPPNHPHRRLPHHHRHHRLRPHLSSLPHPMPHSRAQSPRRDLLPRANVPRPQR